MKTIWKIAFSHKGEFLVAYDFSREIQPDEILRMMQIINDNMNVNFGEIEHEITTRFEPETEKDDSFSFSNWLEK